MILDCHAHAFPSLLDKAEELVSRVGGAQAQSSLKAARAFASAFAKTVSVEAKRAAERLGTKLPPLDIETVATFQASAKSNRGPLVEAAGAVALALPVALRGTVEALVASMDRVGIAKTVLIGAPGVAPNEWLLSEATPYGRGRFIPVATLPPLPHDAPRTAWIDAYEKLAKDGAAGFKIHPNMDGLGAQHVAWEALFEVAKVHRRFVILHTGCFHVPTYKVGGPVDVEAFERHFAAFPDVRVCLAHMGREHPERVWAAMKRYPQLYTDTSWQKAETIRAAVDIVGSERILLGSDWPLLHQDLQADALGILRKAFGESPTFQAITGDNARRFLGIAG